MDAARHTGPQHLNGVLQDKVRGAVFVIEADADVLKRHAVAYSRGAALGEHTQSATASVRHLGQSRG